MAENKIITYIGCLTNDSNCFSNGRDKIIIDSKRETVDVKNPCVFPFKYRDKSYDSCTKDGDKQAFWCATSVDADLYRLTTGRCNDACPLEGKQLPCTRFFLLFDRLA